MQYYIDQLWERIEKGLPLQGVQELAKGYPMSPKAIRDGAEAGKLPAIKIGCRWYSTKKILIAWEKDQQTTLKRGAKKPNAKVRISESGDQAYAALIAMGMDL